MKRLLVLGFVLVFILTSWSVLAEYPEKSVSIICPWSAGGGTDRLARFVAGKLEQEFGKPFVVVNRTGGGGAVGHGAGAYAAADGYTITLVTLEIANMHWLGLTPLTYDDFDYIIQLNQDPSGVMVKADAPWKDIGELLDDINANPGKFKFSGSGAGTIWDLARIGMLDAAGIAPESVLWIPTGGAAPSIVELLGGHVDVITCSLAEAGSQLEAGDIRALAIMADERDSRFADVPTLKEQGVDWSAGTWRGLAVPKGTPGEIKDALYEKALKLARSEEYLQFMNNTGFGVQIRGPEEFYQFVKEQDTTWKDVLRIGGYLKE